ncbi:MAG TPA: GNAT family N-acetyltransferase [Armatimonadota bacterium]|nr:GNAT family N-acetyltransferase [Armatimonadota bacterium]
MLDTGSVTVRRARQEDLDAIVALWVELVEYHHNLDCRLWEAAEDGTLTYREWALESMGEPRAAVLVAEVDGEVVGFAHALPGRAPASMRERAMGVIADVCVAPGHRNRGVGRRLAEAAISHFVEQGMTEVMLSAAVGNEGAVRFWRSLGFDPILYSMHRPLA